MNDYTTPTANTELDELVARIIVGKYGSVGINGHNIIGLTEEQAKSALLALIDRLREIGEDQNVSASWLSELTNDVPSVVHAVQYAKIVARYATLRRVLTAAREIAQMTQNFDGDYDSLLVAAEERINGVTRQAARQQNKLELVDLQEYMTYAREHREPEGTIRGLSTGLQKIDKMTQGFLPWLV